MKIPGQGRAFGISHAPPKASPNGAMRRGSRPLTLAAAFSLAACVPRTPEPELRFDMSGIAKEAQTKAEKSCEFEAEKAIIPIRIGVIAAEQWRRIYTLCLEAKGAKRIPPMTTAIVFRTAGLSDERWNSVRKECSDEAEKAVAPADPETPVEDNRNRVFVTCAELKGAAYVGYARLPAERWNAIRKRCAEEFEAAFAGLPESRRRGELRDERKLACVKRNGISLQDGLP